MLRRLWLKCIALATGVVATFCPLALAFAHHSLTAYEWTDATVTGVVRDFRFVNPHPLMTITVAASGGDETWTIEFDNRRELAPLGMHNNTYRPQDKVIVTGWPGRGGQKIMYMRRLERPSDGMIWEQIGGTPRLVSRGNLGR